LLLLSGLKVFFITGRRQEELDTAVKQIGTNVTGVQSDVSNLVFHNFCRKRFDAYERLRHWATPESYIVLGDLFFNYKKDSKLLTSLFGSIQEKPGSMIDGVYKMLVLSELKK
jgi:hypothetical protein